MARPGPRRSLSTITASLKRLAAQPCSIEGEAGRARERHRRIALSAVSAVGARAVALLGSLITFPIVLRHLGSERFGLWVTITTLVWLLPFADLGLGQGLVNAIADADGRHDRDRAISAVSSGFFGLLALALVLGGIFMLVQGQISWVKLFNVQTATGRSELGPALSVFVACFIATMPLGVAQRTFLGYQQGFRANVWLTVGSLAALLATVSAVALEAGLPWLVLATSGGPLVTGILSSASLFGRRMPWLRPRIARIQKATIISLVRLGLLFFVLGVAGSLGYYSDNLVITSILGPEAVTSYAVPMKLFSVAPVLLGFLLTPLWPAYREALTRGDLAWVRRTFARSIRWGLALNIPPAVVLILTRKPVFHLWSGGQVRPDMTLLTGLLLFAAVNALTGPMAALLNGATVIRLQVLWSLIMGTSSLAVSIYLVNRIGVAGAVFGTVTAQTLFLVIPFSLYIRFRFFREDPGGAGPQQPGILGRMAGSDL